MPEPKQPPHWRDLLAFLNALRHQVVALVCGGILAAALGVAQGFGWQVKPAWYGVILYLFFVIAAFGAWFEQRRDVDELRSRFSVALDISQITRAFELKQLNGEPLTAIALTVSVRNAGAPTCLVHWHVWIKNYMMILHELPLMLTDSAFSYGPQDDLIYKTAETPIAQGAVTHGIILCFLDKVGKAFHGPGAVVTVQCCDVTDDRHQDSIVVPDDMGAILGPEMIESLARLRVSRV